MRGGKFPSADRLSGQTTRSHSAVNSLTKKRSRPYFRCARLTESAAYQSCFAESKLRECGLAGDACGVARRPCWIRDSWRSAAEVATVPLLVALAGAEIVTGIGLRDTYTLLYPEAIILDDDLYQRARYSLLEMEVSPDTLAVDVTARVKPGGHYLSQKHTRKYMRTSMVRGIIHQLDSLGKYRDPVEVAREKVGWILENHQPEPPSAEVQKEINRILTIADQELGT